MFFLDTTVEEAGIKGTSAIVSPKTLISLLVFKGESSTSAYSISPVSVFKNISKFEILSYVKKDRFGGAYIECIDCNIDFNKIYNDELSVIAYEK